MHKRITTLGVLGSPVELSAIVDSDGHRRALLFSVLFSMAQLSVAHPFYAQQTVENCAHS